MRPKWFGREDGELVGQKTGWRRVQYSEKLFPVFVLTSSLISLMQRKSSEERKMKALTSKQSPPPKKNEKENMWISLGSWFVWCRFIYMHVHLEHVSFEYENVE